MNKLIILLFIILLSSCKTRSQYTCYCHDKKNGEYANQENYGKASKETAYAKCKQLAPDTSKYTCVMQVLEK